MTKSERIIYAKALAETFPLEELQQMRKKALIAGNEGRVTSWGDVGLSSQITYAFDLGVAIDVLSAAISIVKGETAAVGKKDRIRKFVL
ncbi:MAG: hypothetical protein E7079_08125 [Bacteroidales bacterium]|nr:hypothetical protein [Bacteroidales bacterium]